MENTTNGNKNGVEMSGIRSTAPYEMVKGIADFILARTTVRPRVGMICGTGMSSVPGMINKKLELDYADIPHFPRSTVEGHAGKLILGYIGDIAIMCMRGRVHYYEGYDIDVSAMPVRVMKLCGVTHLIMSNAAGALNSDFEVGDIMILKDHVNFLSLSGTNPLRGPNDERWGPRFFPTNNLYDKGMRQKAKEAAQEIECESQFHEGIFAMVGGPNFETVAECRMLRMLGIDTVGMSTAHEALVGYHCGMKVFGFSLVTNKCDFDYDVNHTISHHDIMASGFKMEMIIRAWIYKLIEKIAKDVLSTAN